MVRKAKIASDFKLFSRLKLPSEAMEGKTKNTLDELLSLNGYQDQFFS
jgi:hypothetical protein